MIFVQVARVLFALQARSSGLSEGFFLHVFAHSAQRSQRNSPVFEEKMKATLRSLQGT